MMVTTAGRGQGEPTHRANGRAMSMRPPWQVMSWPSGGGRLLATAASSSSEHSQSARSNLSWSAGGRIGLPLAILSEGRKALNRDLLSPIHLTVPCSSSWNEVPADLSAFAAALAASIVIHHHTNRPMLVGIGSEGKVRSVTQELGWSIYINPQLARPADHKFRLSARPRGAAMCGQAER